MDVDESRQYSFRSLQVTGVSSTTALYLIEDWDSSLKGKPFDTAALESFIAVHHPDIPATYNVERDTDVRRDDARCQVDITLNVH